jgi:hypothetical protein
LTQVNTPFADSHYHKNLLLEELATNSRGNATLAIAEGGSKCRAPAHLLP